MISSVIYLRCKAVQFDAVAFLGRDFEHRRTTAAIIHAGGGASSARREIGGHQGKTVVGLRKAGFSPVFRTADRAQHLTYRACAAPAASTHEKRRSYGPHLRAQADDEPPTSGPRDPADRGPPSDVARGRSATPVRSTPDYAAVVAMENKHDPFLLAWLHATGGKPVIPLDRRVAFAAQHPACQCRWDLAGATGGRSSSPGLAGAGHTAPLLGAVDAAGAAHARICPDAARDLRCWKTARSRPSKATLPFYLDDPNFAPSR